MKKRLLAAALAAVFVFALAGAASADEPFDENEWDAVETMQSSVYF